MLKGFIEKLSDDCPLAVDTETDGLRPDRARLVGVSLAARGGSALYIPVLIREQGGDRSGAGGGTLFAPASETSHLEWVRRHLGPLLRDEARVKIGHNLKFDEWILSRHGMPLGGPRFDTMVAAYVLDPGGRGYGLKELADELLDERMTTYNELFAAGDRVRDILNVPPERLAVYAAADADMTYRLHELMQARLDEAGLAGLFHEMEMPLSAVLFRMERNGIKIDLEFLSRLGREFAAELVSLEKRIYAQAGQEFNVQSPQQLSEILFKKLGLKPAKKTATGWSTDVSVLAELAEQHPLPALILEHRQLAKLQNTYVDSLPQLAEPQTGLIHTSFNQAVAATGRLSSSDPNLQNIPVRTAQGRSIRKAFIPRQEDHVLLSADYSQVELRLLAHLSGDRNLQEVFRSGGDVHRRTAALIAGVTEDRVTGAMRRRAKAINFGVIYGMGARSLAKQIAVTVKEATAFIDAYFATYPGVRAFITQAKEKARKTGFTETLLGRRRRLPDILSGNNRLRSFQERIAVNTPIQGTAADVIKLAMIELDRRLRTEKRESMLLLQVHDELLLEVPTGERDCMESVLELSVPLTVDMHVGRNWADAHE
jgi:DNA polymerase-1